MFPLLAILVGGVMVLIGLPLGRDGDGFGWFMVLFGAFFAGGNFLKATKPGFLTSSDGDGPPPPELPVWQVWTARGLLAAVGLAVIVTMNGLGGGGGGGGGDLSEQRCASLRLVFLANNNSDETIDEALSDYRRGNCDRFE